MFSELNRMAEINDVFKKIPSAPELRLVWNSLPNVTNIEDFKTWIWRGIGKNNPEPNGVVDLFSKDSFLVVAGMVSRDARGNGLFVGIVSSYNFDDESIGVVGRFENTVDVIEMAHFEPDGSVSWHVFDKPEVINK